MKKNNQAGFTLLEGIVTMLIMAAAGSMMVRAAAFASGRNQSNREMLRLEEDADRIRRCLERELMNAAEVWIRINESGRSDCLLLILEMDEAGEALLDHGIYYNEETGCLYDAGITGFHGNYRAVKRSVEAREISEMLLPLEEESLLSSYVSKITWEPVEKASKVMRYEYELCSPCGLTQKYGSAVLLRNHSSDPEWKE